MAELRKKIKFLKQKRKALPWLYAITFGTAWLIPIIFYSANIYALHQIGVIVFVVFHLLGVMVYFTNEKYWHRGLGDKFIEIDKNGIVVYETLFNEVNNRLERDPIVSWSEIWDFEFSKTEPSVFVIYTSDDALSGKNIPNLNLKATQKLLQNNQSKYGFPFILRPDDFHYQEFYAFLEEFKFFFFHAAR